MNVLVELVKALAWPITILVIVLLFKRELSLLQGRLSEFRYGNFAAKFAEQLDKVEEDASRSVVQTRELPPPSESRAEQQNAIRDEILRIATVSPRAAVSEAWRHLELAMDSAAQSLGFDQRGAVSRPRLIRLLAEQGLLDTEAVQLYESLRRMRNEAVHRREFDGSQPEAVRYADVALSLASHIEASAVVARAVEESASDE